MYQVYSLQKEWDMYVWCADLQADSSTQSSTVPSPWVALLFLILHTSASSNISFGQTIGVRIVQLCVLSSSSAPICS